MRSRGAVLYSPLSSLCVCVRAVCVCVCVSFVPFLSLGAVLSVYFILCRCTCHLS